MRVCVRAIIMNPQRRREKKESRERDEREQPTPAGEKNKKRLRMRGVFFKKKCLGLHQKSEKPRLGTKNRKLTPRLGTNPPFLPRKNSKHRYAASVAFSGKYKSTLVNENIQRIAMNRFFQNAYI